MFLMKNTEDVTYSTSPSGETFSMPQKDDYDIEYQHVKQLVTKARADHKEIVLFKEIPWHSFKCLVKVKITTN